MSDLVVYDNEATDADVRHGQITQFGAIRADMDFNVLEDKNLRVRRLPWVVRPRRPWK
jgi:Exonuclease I